MTNKTDPRALVERLKEKALFGCRNPCCASEVSYDADNLAVAPDGEPTCRYCWDEDRTDDDPEWCDLPAFLPFDFITAALDRIEALEADIEDMRDSVAELEGFGRDWPSHGNVPLAIVARYALYKQRESQAWSDAIEAAASLNYPDEAIAKTYYDDAAMVIRKLKKGETT